MTMPRLYRVSALSLAISTTLCSQVFAQASEKDVERIEVVGVRQPFRGDVPLTEQPQNVQILTAEQLNDSAATTLVDTLNLTPSVAQQNNFGGLWDSFAIRGLVGDENIPSGYLINGYTSGRGFSGTRDTSNIALVEIMKGPGSALYGRSEPGGTINILTKKPQFAQQGYFQLTMGSWNSYRAEGDYTNAVNEQLAFRVNGAYEDNESFRDYINSEKIIFTPSLLWLISDDTKLSYELEYVDQQSVFDRGIVAIDGNIKALPIERFLGNPNDAPTQVDVKAHQLTLEHTLNSWSLLAGLSYKDSSFVSESSDAELAPARQLLFTDGETLSRQHNQRDFQTTDLSARLELSGQLNLGQLTHHILMGVDGYQFSFDKYWVRYRPAPGETNYSINVFQPDYTQLAPEGSLLRDDTEKQESYGVYIQDQIDLSEQWKVQIGGRYDRFEQSIASHKNNTISEQEQSTFSPRAGIVYEYSDNIQYYASYAQGFRPNTGADLNGNAFEPETTKSIETGMKFSTADLNASVALFHAEKSNMLTTDLDAGASTALGQVNSDGVELELNGELTSSTLFWLSYTYTDAKTAKDMVNTDWWVSLPKGSSLLNIPKHSGNVTIKQNLDIFDVNADLGVSVQYVGERLGETIDPSYKLPAYTLVNLFAQYRVNDDLSLQLNINNLFDKTHYINSYSALWTQPGAPVNYKISLRYSF